MHRIYTFEQNNSSTLARCYFCNIHSLCLPKQHVCEYIIYLRKYFVLLKCSNDDTGVPICTLAELPYLPWWLCLCVAEMSRWFQNSWDGATIRAFSECVQVELPEEETTENLPGYRALLASRKTSWSPHWAPCLLPFPLNVYSPFIFPYNGIFNLLFHRLQSIQSYTLKKKKKLP